MNDFEREAIILNSAWKIIDGMVNWVMFEKTDLSTPTNLMFRDREHAKIFVILLGDFLSQIRAYKKEPMPLGLKEAPDNACPSDLTFLYHIRQVCEAPKLGEDAGELQREVESFADWLEGEFVLPKAYLADICVEVDLQIARHRYLKMCGDIAKHHLGRLSHNVRHIHQLLAASGHLVTEYDAYLAVDNFFEWFFEYVFLYHSGQIAEFLNNIRWQIFRYLEDEYRRSYHLTDEATPGSHAYSYNVPEQIGEPIARAMYWDVMNRVRQEPWIPKFVVADIYKQRY